MSNFHVNKPSLNSRTSFRKIQIGLKQKEKNSLILVRILILFSFPSFFTLDCKNLILKSKRNKIKKRKESHQMNGFKGKETTLSLAVPPTKNVVKYCTQLR